MVGSVARLVLVGVLLIAACTSDDDGDVTPTATTSPATPTATAPSETETATTTPTTRPVEPVTATRQPPADLPDGVALLVATGPSGTESPDEAVHRIQGGTIPTAEEIFAPDEGQHITGIVANADASTIYVAVCSAGECGIPMGIAEDPEMTLFRSSDGGVTWEEVDRREVAYWPVGVSADGALLVRTIPEATDPPMERFEWLETMAIEQRPVDPSPSAARSPFVLPDGRVLWFVPPRVLMDSSGAVVLDVARAVGAEEPLDLWSVAASPDGERLAVGWTVDGSHAREALLSVFAGDRLEQTFVLSAEASASHWLSDSLLVGNAGGFLNTELGLESEDPYYVGAVPVLIDLEAATMTPLAPFLEEPYLYGRNLVIGAILIR